MSNGSLSLLLIDVRSLVTRLQDQDKLLDDLHKQASSLNDKIKCMKDYEDCSGYTSLRNSVNPAMSLSELIATNLQQENRQIKLLQAENIQLKLSLQEHQAALDAIMTKYRQQIFGLLDEVKLGDFEHKIQKCKEDSADNWAPFFNACNLTDEMRSCLRLCEGTAHQDQLDLASLKAENSALRQLLKLAAQNDSAALIEFLQFLQKQADEKVWPPCSLDLSPKDSNEDQHTPTRESINSENIDDDL